MLMAVAVRPKTRVMVDCVELGDKAEAGAITKTAEAVCGIRGTLQWT